MPSGPGEWVSIALQSQLYWDLTVNAVVKVDDADDPESASEEEDE